MDWIDATLSSAVTLNPLFFHTIFTLVMVKYMCRQAHCGSVDHRVRSSRLNKTKERFSRPRLEQVELKLNLYVKF